MQFKPNYKPADDKWREMIDSLTEKQKSRYWSTRKLPETKRVKALQAEITQIREQCYEAFNTWFEQFRRNFSGELDATVLWFNSLSGLGQCEIQGANGETIRGDLYACNIKGKRTWYPETACVYYNKGQQIKVKLDFHGRQSPVFVIGLTQGHFDAEKWNSLDQSKLAFRCNEDGEAITGLFA